MTVVRSIRYGLAANYAGMLSLAIAVNLLPVFLITFSHEFGGDQGLTNEQLGRLAAITFVGLVGGILIAGPLADRWGAKPFALAGNGLVAVGLLGLGLARDYPAVCRAMFVMGTGAGILDMVLSPIVCALQPDRRTAAMNWLHSFYCTGAAVTVLLGSLSLKWGLGWRTLSLGLAIVPALVLAAFAFMAVPSLVRAGTERLRLRGRSAGRGQAGGPICLGPGQALPLSVPGGVRRRRGDRPGRLQCRSVAGRCRRLGERFHRHPGRAGP